MSVAVLLVAGLSVLMVKAVERVGAMPDPATSAPPYTPSEEPSGVYLDDLTTGDCANGLYRDEDTITDVTVVVCTGPHEGEFLARVVLPNGRWMGESASERMTDSLCERYAGTLIRSGTTAGESVTALNFYPTKEGWPDDRSGLCFAVHKRDDGTKLAAPIRR
ncbi:hypothetical protein [Nonomuraea sediminis]|uniref:hypothetical protein n=1 Tax=Nonomuraea sediminis TaxID=2835864 RepID=UPI001BDC150C|nr:hypothetical protein [Nonomuraea sediminis]